MLTYYIQKFKNYGGVQAGALGADQGRARADRR